MIDIYRTDAERSKKNHKSKRKPRTHLTKRQKAFFKCLEENQYNMHRAMMLCKIKDWLMDRWFKDPVFIATLKNRYRQIEFRTHMELTYNLSLAAMNLANMTYGFDTETMLRACTNVLRFHSNTRPYHECAFKEKDRPLPRPRLRKRDRLLLQAKVRPKDPALALSRQFLDDTDADDYKRVQKLEEELEKRRLLTEQKTAGDSKHPQREDSTQ